jgi:diadenosine tetraphosphate (Ap4A) HIT family hydrolase
MRFVLLLLLAFANAASAAEARPCPFCEIVAGTRPAAIVYRDPTVLAFMSIGARNAGHVLVIPVQHAENLLELPSDTARDLIVVAQKIARAIKASDLPAEGIQLKMNTGKAAGQTVFHAHLHIIPRFAAEPPERTEKDPPVPLPELEAAAAKIRAQLQ